jgi:hypothetical protein
MDAKPRRIRLKLSVSAAVYALVVAVVLTVAWVNPVIREGNSHDFWDAACGVFLDGDYDEEQRCAFTAFRARDGWLVYAPNGLINSPALHRVREEEAFADFPEVVKHLDRPERRQSYRELDLSRWREADPEAADPRLFLEEVRAARLQRLKWAGNGGDQRLLAHERLADECWWRAHNWRPVQVAAELVYFAGLASWLLWPWWRSARWTWYAAHLAWLPWLLLAPYWLSYSAAITPEGGVLYSIVRLYVPALESVEPQADPWKSLPRPLASLPGQVGAAGLAEFTIRPGQGPFAALAWSVILAGPVLLIGVGVRAYRRRRLALERRDVRAASYSWWSLLWGDE